MKEEATERKIISLKVAEASSRDVGRGIARIDPKDMTILGLDIGDIIKIKAKRETVAKAMPTYPDARGKGLIQIDGITRENARVGIDEKVTIQWIAHCPAEWVVIAPATLMTTRHREGDLNYLGTLFAGLPVVEGDRIRANLFGARHQDFTVMATSPKGVVAIQPDTAIRLKDEKEAAEIRAKVSYEDIGGLDKAIQRVRELIELPLRYPEIFERLGIDAPKGVLLHGPPGTGKTLIARAVANETEANFLHLSGPEVISKFYGESEKRLREVFEEASARAPSIIFLDEIDAIAPKREEMGGEKQVERRVVAQLLALMDGLSSRGQVIVIGATNIPNVLDPALRRPGRFDREIEIGIPDRNGRLNILHIHTRGMPLAHDVDLDKLAEITHGFVGADLEALAREAAMTALRKIAPAIDFGLEGIPYETILKLEVTMEDFLDALKEIEPSAIREIFVEVPNTNWSQVGGMDEVKQQLIEAIDWPLKYPKLFERARIKPPKGILLHGPPGCGKTLLAKAVATETKANFIAIKGPAIMSKYVGESERAVRELFKRARQAAPCILFLDEIDSIAATRSNLLGDAGVSGRVISQLLTEMDGIEALNDVVVLGATNRIDMIDHALLRPGRFDIIILLPKPDSEERLKIFEVHLKDKPVREDIDLKKYASLTEGLVGADIELICRKALMLALKEFLDSGGSEDGSDKFSLSGHHLKASWRLFEAERKAYCRYPDGSVMAEPNQPLT